MASKMVTTPLGDVTENVANAFRTPQQLLAAIKSGAVTATPSAVKTDTSASNVGALQNVASDAKTNVDVAPKVDVNSVIDSTKKVDATPKSVDSTASTGTDLFQGAALPSVTTTVQRQATAPQFYTDYLQDIANLGQSAVKQGGIAGMSPLQLQALGMAPNIAFSGAETLGQGAQLAGAAGTTPTTALIGQYMNPYTSSVVGEMGRLTQRNVQENVLPALGAGAAATGGFGSRRQQQITGQTMRDIQSDLLGRQYGALQSGYTQAGQMAQGDLTRMLQSGQALGQLGGEQQQLGLKGLESLFNLGAQEQTQGQKTLDYPMQQATNFAQLMRQYQIPTGEIQETTGPQAGAYGLSPMSQISGLLSTLAAFSNPAGVNLSGAPKKDGGAISKQPAGAAYRDKKGNFYDADGYLLG